METVGAYIGDKSSNRESERSEMLIEMLLAVELADRYEIAGITYFGATNIGPEYVQLKASSLAIVAVKAALAKGLKIVVSKNHQFAEVTPADLVIEKVDQLETKKRLAICDITSLMHQNIIGINIIDAMAYLNSYMKLLAAGIFIHDGNREDKYFEIIEKAQSCQEPEPLKEDASFDEEQKFVEQKNAYEQAQGNLKTLEDYLNSFDQLSKIGFINKLLQDAKRQVLDATTEEEVDLAIKTYKEKLDSNFYAPIGNKS